MTCLSLSPRVLPDFLFPLPIPLYLFLALALLHLHLVSPTYTSTLTFTITIHDYFHSFFDTHSLTLTRIICTLPSFAYLQIPQVHNILPDSPTSFPSPLQWRPSSALPPPLWLQRSSSLYLQPRIAASKLSRRHIHHPSLPRTGAMALLPTSLDGPEAFCLIARVPSLS